MLKSAKSAATSATILILAFAPFCGASSAMDTPKYDKRIEAAAKEIVAKKIGDIRGSVEEAAWVAEFGIDDVTTGPVPKDQAAAEPKVQVASLTALRPDRPMNTQAPVRKISSFLYF